GVTRKCKKLMPSHLGITANIQEFRASFRQPIGILNPLGLKVRMAIGVVLARVAPGGAQFQALWSDGRHPVGFGIRNATAPALAQRIHQVFEEQTEPWRAYDAAGLHHPLIEEELNKCLIARGVKPLIVPAGSVSVCV